MRTNSLVCMIETSQATGLRNAGNHGRTVCVRVILMDGRLQCQTQDMSLLPLSCLELDSEYTLGKCLLDMLRNQ